jgi:hypothetical protein
MNSFSSCTFGLLFFGCQFAAQAQTNCVADFSALGQGQLRIEIKQRSDGLFDAAVNGVTTNSGGKVVDEVVRSSLNLGADPYGGEFSQFNSAERSLVHLQSLLDSPATRQLIKVSFSPGEVRRMKTFDLIGKTDKFGGQVLLEAYGPGDVLLGKLIRRVFVTACQ